MNNIFAILDHGEIAVSSIVGELEPHTIKTVRLHGDYPFHSHADSDETFIILNGSLEMDREGFPPQHMTRGDVLKIPQNLKHRTRANTPCDVLLIGPK